MVDYSRTIKLDYKVGEFILDLLDKEIEEVNMALRWDKTPFTVADIDKLCESRKYVNETGILDQAAYNVCFNWLHRDVNHMHPNDAGDAAVHNEEVTLRVVGGVYMLIQHYAKLKDVAQDMLCDVWEYVPSGYRRYIDKITTDGWNKLDYKVLEPWIDQLEQPLSKLKAGWEHKVHELVAILDNMMEVIKC